MNALLRDAVTGKLRSPRPEKSGSATFCNLFPVSVDLFRCDTLGRRHFVMRLPFNDEAGKSVPAYDGERFVVLSFHTGGLMAAYEIEPGKDKYQITPYDLALPFDIGPIPLPTRDVPIPPDSTRVVTGIGLQGQDVTIFREQFWSRLDESYMLAPAEKKTVTYTTTSGLSETSSDQETVNKSLSVGVSGGWGPISASVNAALNQTSTTSHQVTVTQQKTTFFSDQLDNPGDKSAMFLRWQLTDVVTIYSSSVPSGASIVSGENPVLVSGPWVIEKLESEPSFHAEFAKLDAAEKNRLQAAARDGLKALAAARSQALQR